MQSSFFSGAENEFPSARAVLETGGSPLAIIERRMEQIQCAETQHRIEAAQQGIDTFSTQLAAYGSGKAVDTVRLIGYAALSKLRVGTLATLGVVSPDDTAKASLALDDFIAGLDTFAAPNSYSIQRTMTTIGEILHTTTQAMERNARLLSEELPAPADALAKIRQAVELDFEAAILGLTAAKDTFLKAIVSVTAEETARLLAAHDDSAPEAPAYRALRDAATAMLESLSGPQALQPEVALLRAEAPARSANPYAGAPVSDNEQERLALVTPGVQTQGYLRALLELGLNDDGDGPSLDEICTHMNRPGQKNLISAHLRNIRVKLGLNATGVGTSAKANAEIVERLSVITGRVPSPEADLSEGTRS